MVPEMTEEHFYAFSLDGAKLAGVRKKIKKIDLMVNVSEWENFKAAFLIIK